MNRTLSQQAHALGRIYGIMSTAMPQVITPAKLSAAAISPLSSVAEGMRLLTGYRVLTNRLDQAIGNLLGKIDPDFPAQIGLDLQGPWWAGYYAGQRPVEQGIVAMRKGKNLSQTQLAKELNDRRGPDEATITQQAICRWENGLNTPTAESYKVLADVLECRIEDLMP